MRKCQVGPAGFQDYLGERFDEDSGQWTELYGRKAELTLGLDLYAPEETEGAAMEAALFRLARALVRGGPPDVGVNGSSPAGRRSRTERRGCCGGACGRCVWSVSPGKRSRRRYFRNLKCEVD
ncbi:MAG: hypothetical protein V8S34_08605 [Lawsonibacter sp.]